MRKCWNENDILGLYEISFPNGKRYIGVSTNPNMRRLDHLGSSRRGSKLIVHQAIRKYGEKNIGFKTLVIGQRDYILALEKSAIIAFNSSWHANGYNVGLGGETSPATSPLVRAKISAALTGRPLSAKHRATLCAGQKRRYEDPAEHAKISAAHKGSKHSQETCDKMRMRMTRLYENPEEREKLSKKNIGRAFSVEHRLKLSEAAKRREKAKTPEMKIAEAARHSAFMKGRPCSPEQRAKISIAMKLYRATKMSAQTLSPPIP